MNEIDILELLFVAEIEGSKISPQIPGKSKKIRELILSMIERGLIEPCQSDHCDTLGKYSISGYMLTFKGHMKYCDWAASLSHKLKLKDV